MDYMTMNFNRNGGSGTSDYSQLSNKPSINDVTLSGNKTASDLGLMDHYDIDEAPTEDSDNLVTSKAVWEADEEIEDKLQGSKTASSTSGTIEIPDYGMTESIQMYFKPTQDLHGYDKPWAGGAGKNKFGLPYKGTSGTNVGITTTVNSDSSVRFQGTSQGEFYWSFKIDNVTLLLDAGTYTISSKNDIPQGVTIFIQNSSTYINAFNKSRTLTFSEPTNLICYIYIPRAENNIDFTAELQLEEGNQATTFEPYSNICPISGQDNATFEWTDSHDDDWELQMNFGKTCYGGFCQFNGQVYSQWSYIASYNGETLSGEWVSDRDEYVAGTTPTIGAEVAYYDSQSTDYFRVTPPANLNLTDDYPIEYNGYMASIGYQPKNTVLAEAKRYTNQEIAKLGFPQPPTIDGTYHLECSVSGGIPTIRWVSNS